mgnify:CR=1 FL=1
MPLYEYKCTQCGSVVESIQKVSDAPLKACSQCGGPLRKLVSSPAIQFKGSGFYITDYARKDTDATKAPGKPQAKGSTKTETKDKDKKESASAEKSQASSPTS